MDSLYLLSTKDSSLALYNLNSDPELKENLANDKRYDSVFHAIDTVFRAYQQTGLNALIRDKVYPPETGIADTPTIKH